MAKIGRTHREIQQGGHRIGGEDELWGFHMTITTDELSRPPAALCKNHHLIPVVVGYRDDLCEFHAAFSGITHREGLEDDLCLMIHSRASSYKGVVQREPRSHANCVLSRARCTDAV